MSAAPVPPLPPGIPDDIGQCMGRSALMTSRAVTRAYNEFLRETGLQVTQFSVLAAVRIGRYATLSQLADQLALERTSLLRNIELLRRSGLVRDEAGKRGRARHLTLTAEGEAVLARCIPLWRQAQDAFQAALGPEDADAVRAGLRRLRRAAATVSPAAPDDSSPES
jgi:DNA-binding MarR family transcriptional regulator